MPKIVDKEQKKREIVSKALDVFSQSGFRDSNLQQIASKCGYSRTTLYNYFKNKEEIYYFALDAAFSRIEDESKLIVASTSLSTEDKIKAVIKSVMMNIGATDKSAALMVDFGLQIKTGNLRLRKKVQDSVVSLQNTLTSLLDEGKREGFYKPIDSQAIASTLLALVQSFIVNSVLTGINGMDVRMDSLTIVLNSLKL